MRSTVLPRECPVFDYNTHAPLESCLTSWKGAHFLAAVAYAVSGSQPKPIRHKLEIPTTRVGLPRVLINQLTCHIDELPRHFRFHTWGGKHKLDPGLTVVQL